MADTGKDVRRVQTMTGFRLRFYGGGVGCHYTRNLSFSMVTVRWASAQFFGGIAAVLLPLILRLFKMKYQVRESDIHTTLNKQSFQRFRSRSSASRTEDETASSPQPQTERQQQRQEVITLSHDEPDETHSETSETTPKVAQMKRGSTEFLQTTALVHMTI